MIRLMYVGMLSELSDPLACIKRVRDPLTSSDFTAPYRRPARPEPETHRLSLF